MNFKLHHGDCLQVMRTLPDASVDCVLTDPPYGTTACKWDSVISFEPMWKELKRIAKPKSAIALFASQPFTSALVSSNYKMFRYGWVWDKRFAGNFSLAKFQPLKRHEDVLVFSQSPPRYFPQMVTRDSPITLGKNVAKSGSANLANAKAEYEKKQYDMKYPESIVFCNVRGEGMVRLHPTQKPVELLRYLIRTYTQEGETVLDFTMGSGSTGVACELEGRKFIGIETDDEYFRIATERIEGVRKREPLFMEAAA